VVGVVMNLALWFVLHVVFRQVRAIKILGITPDLPVLSSWDWRAALLSAGAMIAMLRVRVGMIPTLAISALAGACLFSM
jgi:chromate transporter